MEHMQFKKIGKNVTIYPLAKIGFPENISIGDETVIDDFAFIYGTGKGIEIGNFCHITVHCTLLSGGLREIGPGSIVLAQSDDYHGGGFIVLKLFGDKYRNLTRKDVTLGRHVHVGAGSIILPGVTIGDGCSVGAGSLVTKDLPEWTICYGSPCKPVKEKPKEKQLRMEKEFLKDYYKGSLKTSG
jgi:acetyltransferase-like isoleucine patch superfamily enzyme